MLASVKPRVNVSGARGAGGGRSSGGDPGSRGRSRDSPSTWPAAEGDGAAARSPSRGRLPPGRERTLRWQELVSPFLRAEEGKAGAGSAGAAESARRPDARGRGAAGGQRAAPGSLATDWREGAYWRDPARTLLRLRSSTPRRRLGNAGGEPPVTQSTPSWERVTSRPETRLSPLAVYVGLSQGATCTAADAGRRHTALLHL